MQKVKLPRTVDPIRQAQKNLDYDARIEAENLERLAESTNGLLTDVQVKLHFGLDEQRKAQVFGEAETRVMLNCQRCGEDFEYQVSSQFKYVPVLNEEQTDSIPEAYEPIEVDETGEIDLFTLIEDELLVALPIVPKHDDEHCNEGSSDQSFGDIGPADERPNPFAALEKLKRQ